MKPKVLIVDDSQSIRELIAHHLKDESVDILQADGARAGLQTLARAEGQVSVILLDLNMPEMDGYDFLAALRKKKLKRRYPPDRSKTHAANIRLARKRDAEFHERLRAVPVIIISGRDQAEDVMKARQYGIAGYLVKPFNREAILEKVREIAAADESV